MRWLSAFRGRTPAGRTPKRSRPALELLEERYLPSAAPAAAAAVRHGRLATAAGQLQFASAAYSIGETGLQVTVSVTRTNGSAGAVGVHYSTGDGSAVAGSDYIPAAGTLTWADGDVTRKTFTVGILNDTVPEGTESLNLTLSSPTGGAVVGAPAVSSITILDDDRTVNSPGVIYFESDRADGYRHIFRMDPDGSNVTQLTFGPYNDLIPEASEDGTTVVFASDRANPGSIDYDIFLVNWDGTGLQQITNLPGQQYDPSISPDNRSIVFEGPGVGGVDDLFLYDRQTQTTRNLTSSPANDFNSSWDDNGQTLLYTSQVSNSDEIFLMKFDANMNVIKTNQLTFDTVNVDFYPDISYDGTRVAWSKVTATDTDIYLADLVVDGSGSYSLANVRDLTNSPTTVESIPYFSPDGRWLSFVSNRGILIPPPPAASTSEIFAINIATGEIVRLTNDTYRDLYPTWVEDPFGGSAAGGVAGTGVPPPAALSGPVGLMAYGPSAGAAGGGTAAPNDRAAPNRPADTGPTASPAEVPVVRETVSGRSRLHGAVRSGDWLPGDELAEGYAAAAILNAAGASR